MRVIYKYRLNGLRDEGIEIPYGAFITKVGLDNQGVRSLWACVDPNGRREFRYFAVVDTGVALDDSFVYVGSYTTGPFEKHVFEDVLMRGKERAE